jgi:hypothetical protein
VNLYISSSEDTIGPYTLGRALDIARYGWRNVAHLY